MSLRKLRTPAARGGVRSFGLWFLWPCREVCAAPAIATITAGGLPDFTGQISPRPIDSPLPAVEAVSRPQFNRCVRPALRISARTLDDLRAFVVLCPAGRLTRRTPRNLGVCNRSLVCRCPAGPASFACAHVRTSVFRLGFFFRRFSPASATSGILQPRTEASTRQPTVESSQ